MAPTRVMKSFATTKLAKASRPKHRKGTASSRTKMVREVVREVSGLLPYEKRLLDMIKTAGGAAEKRMYKFAKQRLGGHKRAIKKREDVKEMNMQMRARQAMEK